MNLYEYLQKQLKRLLDTFLSEFIEGESWNEKDVHVAVSDGFILLENLVLKKSLFERLRAPLALKYGSIGKIEMKIPWLGMGAEKVQILIERVFLVVEPKYQWDPEERQQREQNIKSTRLAMADILGSGGSKPGYFDEAKRLLFEHVGLTIRPLLNKVLDNVEVTVREVNVRYEDRVTCSTDFCIGFSLESLHMTRSDPNVDELPVPGRLLLRGPSTLHKYVGINHVGVYWNPINQRATDITTCIFVGRSDRDIENLMLMTTAKRRMTDFKRPRHHYFMEPVDISVELDICVDPSTMRSKACVKIKIPDISINLEDKQYREIMSLQENMSNFFHHEKHAESELSELEGFSIDERNLFDVFDSDNVSSSLVHIETDPNEINYDISVCLSSGSFRLSLSAPDSVYGVSAGESLPFLSFEFLSLRCILLQKGESKLMQTNISLADLSVYEAEDLKVHDQKYCLKLGSKFNKLISRRKRTSLGPANRRKLAFEFDDPDAPLLTAIVDRHLSTSDYEIFVSLTLQELEIIISPGARLIEYLTKFFALPAEKVSYLSAMMMHAMNRLPNLKTRLDLVLDAKFEYMTTHLMKNIMVEMKMKAPILILAESTEIVPGMNLVIVDLGYVFLSTQKRAKSELQTLIDESNESIFDGSTTIRDGSSIFDSDGSIADGLRWSNTPLSQERKESDNKSQRSCGNLEHTHSLGAYDTNTLEPQEYFDVYLMEVLQVEVCLTVANETWRQKRPKQLDTGVFFDKFDIAIEIQISVLPWNTLFAPIKLFVGLPVLNIKISESEIVRLLNFYQSISLKSQEFKKSPNSVRKVLEFFSQQLKHNSIGVAQAALGNSNGGGMIFEPPRTASIDNFSDYASVKSTESSLKTSLSKMKKDIINDATSESSEDDFFEAKEHPEELSEELIQKITEIQNSLKKKEAVFSSLLSGLRLTEEDKSDQSNDSLYSSIKDELKLYEEDIRKLKISLIESHMKLRESVGSDDFSDSFTKNYHKISLDHRLEVVSNLLNFSSTEVDEKISIGAHSHPRKYHIEPLVPPEACNHVSEKDNERPNHKRFLYAQVHVPVMNIDVSCDVSHHQKVFGDNFMSHTSSDVVTLKCEITEISGNAKLSSGVTTISLIVRGIDIEDSVLTILSGGNGPVYLISSEPTMAGHYMSHDRFRESGSSDLFRVEVKAKHPDSLTCYQISAKAEVGFLGLSIDQRTATVLIYFAQHILSQTSQTKHDSPNHLASSRLINGSGHSVFEVEQGLNDVTLSIGKMLFHNIPISFGDLECNLCGVECRVLTDFSENASMISLVIGNIQHHLHLEKYADSNIFANSFVISDICLLIDKKPLIDSFTVSIIAAIGTSSSQLLCFPFDWSKVSASKTVFPPKTVHLTPDCNILFSVGVSPILFRINEDLSDRVRKLLQLVPKNEHASDRRRSVADKPTFYRIVDKVQVDILLYELLFSVEVRGDGILEAEKRAAQSSISSVNRGIIVDEKFRIFHPQFAFAIREINLRAIHTPFHEESLEPNDDYVNELNLSVALINLQMLNLNPSAIKRVLYTAPNTDSEVSKCIEASLRYSKSRDVNILLELNKLQIVFASEIIIGLSTELVKILSQRKKKTTEVVDIKTLSLSNDAYVLPSTVPLYMEIPSNLSESRSVVNERLNSVPSQLVLTEESLLLPSIFSGFSIQIVSRGVKCWVPVDEHNSHSQAFCFAAEFELQSSYAYDRSSLSTSMNSVTLLSTNGRIFDVQMFMSSIIYRTIYTVLPSMYSALQFSGSICVHDVIHSTEEVQNFTKKDILFPVEIDIKHSVVFNQGVPNPTLSQNLNIFVSNIESVVYLDFQFFSGIYRNTIKPLYDCVLRFYGYQLFGNIASVLQADQYTHNDSKMECEQKTVFCKTFFDLMPYLFNISDLSFSLTVEAIRIDICNDFFRRPNHFLKITLDDLSIKSTLPQKVIHFKEADMAIVKLGRELMVEMAVKFAIDYSSPSLIVWEPIIERNEITLDCTIPIKYLTKRFGTSWVDSFVSTENEINAIIPMAVSQETGQKSLLPVVTIAMKDILNLNITMSLYEVLLSNGLLKNTDDKKKTTHDLSIAVIRNESGLNINYSISKDSRWISIPKNTEMPLLVDDSDVMYSHMGTNSLKPRRVVIKAETDECLTLLPLIDISMEGQGANIFMLEKINTKAEEMCDKDTICLVMERKILPGGAKMLLIRSTLRLCNSSPNRFHVQLIDGAEIKWEEIVNPTTETYIPAQLCNILTGRLVFKPVSGNQTSVAMEVTLPIPEIPGSADADDALSILRMEGNTNTHRWRRCLQQENDSVDMLTYSHWVEFSKTESFNCNFNIVCYGVPRLQCHSSGNCLLRSITLNSPVVIQNLMACAIEIRRHSTLSRDIENYNLQSGQTLNLMNISTVDDIEFSLRMLSSNSVSRDLSWTEVFVVKGCSEENFERKNISVPMKFENGSILNLLVDVIDSGGSRIICIYVPFWLVSSTSVPLVFQHATGDLSDDVLNGSDGLCADQPYDRLLEQIEFDAGDYSVKCRGSEGVLLGPKVMIRGLKDLIRVSKLPRYLSRLHLQDDHSEGIPGAPLRVDRDRMSFRLTHCGLSDPELDVFKNCLRLKTKDSSWSTAFSLHSLTPISLELLSSSKETSTGWSGSFASFWRPSPSERCYCFGVMTVAAEAPFQRTKIVVIVDRFVIVNSVGQSIDVKQIHSDNFITIHPQEEVPIVWSDSEKLNKMLQVRLSRYGWEWSGKFNPLTEGEVPLRMRNEHDDTICFVLCHVVKEGPRVCINICGGEGVAPYRIENHTLESFRFRQGSSPYSNLLPYHSCLYAWDEPTSSQLLEIEVSRSVKNGHSTEWKVIGHFSFENQKVYSTDDHLDICILTEGSIRVMQIIDRRTSSFPTQVQRRHPFKNEGLVADSRFVSNLMVELKIDAVGVAIIDNCSQEVLYFHSKDIMLQITKKGFEETAKLEIGRLQMDCQLPNSFYPAILYPSKDRNSNGTLGSLGKSGLSSAFSCTNRHKIEAPFLDVSYQRDCRHKNVLFFHYLFVKISPLDLNIEDNLIYYMMTLAQEIINYHKQAASDYSPPISRSLSPPHFIPPETVSADYMPHRQLFFKSVDDTMDIDRRPPIGSDFGTRPLSWAVNCASNHYEFLSDHVVQDMLLRMLRKVAPTRNVVIDSTKVYFERLEISEIKLNFSAKMFGIFRMDNFSCSLPRLSIQHELLGLRQFSGRFVERYVRLYNFRNWSELFFSFFMSSITGSISLNVNRAWNSLKNGFARVMLFLKDLSSKSQEFILHTGLIDSLYMFDIDMTIGEQFEELLKVKLTRNLMHRSKISLRSKQLSLPSNFVNGLGSAFAGLIIDPWKGLRANGFTGFFGGLSIGTVGLLLRPSYGALDYVSRNFDYFGHMIQQLVDDADDKKRFKRGRLTRVLKGPHHLLHRYSEEEENKRLDIFARMSEGKYPIKGSLFYSILLNQQYILLASSGSVLLVGEDLHSCDVKWECSIDLIVLVEVEYQKAPMTIVLSSSKIQELTSDSPDLVDVPFNANPNSVTVNLFYLPDFRSTSGRRNMGLHVLKKSLELSSHGAAISLITHMVELNPKLLSQYLRRYLDDCGSSLQLDPDSPSSQGTMSATLCEKTNKVVHGSGYQMTPSHEIQSSSKKYSKRAKSPSLDLNFVLIERDQALRAEFYHDARGRAEGGAMSKADPEFKVRAETDAKVKATEKATKTRDLAEMKTKADCDIKAKEDAATRAKTETDAKTKADTDEAFVSKAEAETSANAEEDAKVGIRVEDTANVKDKASVAESVTELAAAPSGPVTEDHDSAAVGSTKFFQALNEGHD